MEIEASSYLSSAAVQPGLFWSWSNYRVLSHGVVSYMFNEESDNVVLEYRFTHYVKAGLSLHWAHIQCRIENRTPCKLGYIVQFLSFLNMVDVFWGCTTRFLMDLVGHPKADRFSRGVATALKITQCTSVCSFFNFCN